MTSVNRSYETTLRTIGGPLAVTPVPIPHSCPVLLGTPPGVLDNLAKLGDFIYGDNLSGALAPIIKVSYPDLVVASILFTPGTGGGGAADVRGFAISPDETALVVERIPSGTTSNGNVGPLTAYYRIDPDGVITTIATAGLSVAATAAYSLATNEFYTRRLTGSNDWYRVDVNTGDMTSVVTGFGSEIVTTADGALWAAFSGTQLQRWMPESATVDTFTLDPGYNGNPIPVGNNIWISSASGTGREVDPLGDIVEQPCMTEFPSMFSCAQDLLDSNVTICIDSSPVDLYEINQGLVRGTAVVIDQRIDVARTNTRAITT
jgi:hypothetical protein